MRIKKKSKVVNIDPEVLKKYNEFIKSTAFETKINDFVNTHNMTDKYSARELSRWHMILTMSCPSGRYQFAKKMNIDVNNDYFTVPEFFELCKGELGEEIIKIIEYKMIEKEKRLTEEAMVESSEINKSLI